MSLHSSSSASSSSSCFSSFLSSATPICVPSKLTGDVIAAVLSLFRLLKSCRCPQKLFDEQNILNGQPEIFLQILHFVFFEFSEYFLDFLNENEFALYYKNDQKFTEGVFKILRRSFGYHPKLSVVQFLTANSFVELKILLCCDMIRIARHVHNQKLRAKKNNNAPQRDISNTLKKSSEAHKKYTKENDYALSSKTLCDAETFKASGCTLQSSSGVLVAVTDENNNENMLPNLNDASNTPGVCTPSSSKKHFAPITDKKSVEVSPMMSQQTAPSCCSCCVPTKGHSSGNHNTTIIANSNDLNSNNIIDNKNANNNYREQPSLPSSREPSSHSYAACMSLIALQEKRIEKFEGMIAEITEHFQDACSVWEGRLEDFEERLRKIEQFKNPQTEKTAKHPKEKSNSASSSRLYAQAKNDFAKENCGTSKFFPFKMPHTNDFPASSPQTSCSSFSPIILKKKNSLSFSPSSSPPYPSSPTSPAFPSSPSSPPFPSSPSSLPVISSAYRYVAFDSPHFRETKNVKNEQTSNSSDICGSSAPLTVDVFDTPPCVKLQSSLKDTPAFGTGGRKHVHSDDNESNKYNAEDGGEDDENDYYVYDNHEADQHNHYHSSPHAF